MLLKSEEEINMATTNYAKADAVLDTVVTKYTNTKGFRSATIECDRNLGTYFIQVKVDNTEEIDIPKVLDHVEIQVLKVRPRLPIR